MSNNYDILLIRRNEFKNTLTNHAQLLNDSGWALRWNYDQPKTTYGGLTQKDWTQTLVTKFNEISSQIHKITLRGGANTIVINDKLLNLFDELEYFNNEKLQLSGRYQIIIDNSLPDNKILIYYKPDNRIKLELMNETLVVGKLMDSNTIPPKYCGSVSIDNYKYLTMDIDKNTPVMVHRKYVVINC